MVRKARAMNDEALSESSLIDRNNSALQKIQPDTVTWIVRQIIRTRSASRHWGISATQYNSSLGRFWHLQARHILVSIISANNMINIMVRYWKHV